MRVAVTGGAGFIGANLCRRLLATDGVDSVAVIDDLSNGFRSNLEGLNVTFVEGSILDDAALDRAFAGADAVVHLAALGSVPRSVADPVASHAANATGTLMVLEAARRHGDLHTIVSSSSSVYGSNPTLPKHEGLATRPLSPYGGSKLAAEGYTLAWGATYGLPVLAYRFFNVFGPLQPAGHVYAAVIPAFVDAALAGRPVTVHGDGTQSRDFTYVDTVTSTIIDALLRKVTSDEPVNLAFGSRISLLDTIDRIEELVGYPVERQHIERRAGDVPHSQADNTRLSALFPDIQPVPFDTGLKSTVEWMRSQQSTGA
jgi:UDP-glucose 4-epimerase|tara:strand:- start:43625 stop:44569 length:945 start_codon:yes stop_codon:yes gene_type:complete